MSHTNEFTPRRFGTRGGDVGRKPASKSSPPAVGGSVVCRVSFWMLSCDNPAARRESSRERRRASRVTESAACAESCLLENVRIRLPAESMMVTVTSWFALFNQYWITGPLGGLNATGLTGACCCPAIAGGAPPPPPPPNPPPHRTR